MFADTSCPGRPIGSVAIEALTRIEKITPDNVADAVRLKVKPEQEAFVASVGFYLADAYANHSTARSESGHRALGTW